MQLYHQMLSEVWKYEFEIWNSENIIQHMDTWKILKYRNTDCLLWNDINVRGSKISLY
jgi:hypothetical protein